MAQKIVGVLDPSQIPTARTAARETAAAIGFDENASEEIALAVTELATNLVRHAGGGVLTLETLADHGRIGIQIESADSGPGIPDVETAIGDGYSTGGGPGYGLGTVNRFMDELDLISGAWNQPGTRIVCRRWIRESIKGVSPLAFGVATRPHPLMEVNGDSFVVKQYGESALVSVIDGLGHGQFAHRAAETARRYIEAHADQPLLSLFNGVGRACRATRGVVMAVARFDWTLARLTFASIGNVEARVFKRSEPIDLVVRRGVVGARAPNPVVTEHHWNLDDILVLHSDGLCTHWRWEDFDFRDASPTQMAHQLLRTQARDNDDATVIVVTKANATARDER